MRAKNIEILADFIRKMINTIISKKPVKSRIIEDFEGIKNAPASALLLNGYNKIKGVTIASVITQHLLKTGNLIHCTTKRKKFCPINGILSLICK